MSADSIEAFVAALLKQRADIPVRLEARTDQVLRTLTDLSDLVDASLQRLESHATTRQVRVSQSVDTTRVRDLVNQGHFEQLSRREARHVVLTFLNFRSQAIARVLVQYPTLWWTFARQVLLRWE